MSEKNGSDVELNVESPIQSLSRRSFLHDGSKLAWLAGATSLLVAARARPQTQTESNTTANVPLGNTYLIRGAYVVSMDDEFPNRPTADILIRDGRIAEIAESVDATGLEVIEAGNMIAMPGFIDTHWHLWNSTLKNMSRPDTGYFPLKQVFVAHFEPADHYAANRMALLEAAHAGITTLNNYAHATQTPEHVDAELRAMAESGIGGRYSYGSKDPTTGTEVMPILDVERVKREWFDADSPFAGKVDLGMAIRGPAQTDRAVYLREIQAARELGAPVVIHVGSAKRRYTSCAQLKTDGLLDSSTIVVHGIVQTSEDRAAIAEAGCSLSFAIESELRLQEDGDFRSQLLRMINEGVNLSCSVDSSALSSVSMFEAMSTTWAYGIPWNDTDTQELPELTFHQVLEMATINGAKALGIDDVTGSLTPGKRADVVLVRADDINMVPVANVETALVHSAAVANVDTVIASGKVLKRAGTVVGMDEAAIIEDAKRSLFDLRKRAGGGWVPDDSDSPRF